jgi:hypothetical protein
MGELLANWMPFPRRAPLGVIGLVLVAAFLTLADVVPAHTFPFTLLLVGLCAAGMALSVLSLVREGTKLFGYLGLIGAFMYVMGLLTSFVLFSTRLVG